MPMTRDEMLRTLLATSPRFQTLCAQRCLVVPTSETVELGELTHAESTAVFRWAAGLREEVPERVIAWFDAREKERVEVE